MQFVLDLALARVNLGFVFDQASRDEYMEPTALVKLARDLPAAQGNLLRRTEQIRVLFASYLHHGANVQCDVQPLPH